MSVYETYKKSFWGPTIAWKRLFTKPVTIKIPKVYREAAERYRGFHINDLELCSGCSTCSKICPTDAIKMVPVDTEVEVGKKAQRPAIDYGRCSFCAMCVDICTTGSLKMTREYIHVSDDPNTFFFIPDETGIHQQEIHQGYQRDEDSELLDLERVEMTEIPAEERINSFIEYVKGYSKEQAISEAARCVDCELCVDACPANMDIPRYIESVFNNDTAKGVDWIYKTNPLPGVCGRVCTHKCETVCSIGHRGEAVAIRWLKRYIMDQESEEDIIRHARENIVKKGTGKIAIIGAGPSGLTAAYYLSLMGYDVTIFEAKNLPGGVMRYGIPRYRLPDEALDKDINVIKALGVKIKCNTSVGKDITLNELKEKHDAVFIGTGFTLGRSSEIQGSDHKDVLLALPLLEKIRNYLRNPEESRKPPVPDSLLVIGGGNVAMDVARSIVRLQRLEGKEANVKITSLESMEELPADLEEIVEGREEGIQFFPSRGPKEVVIENGKVKGLKTVACTRVFDEKGQFNPIFDESNVMLIDGEMIVEAIGQAPDYAYLPDELKNKLEFIKGRLIVNEKGQTSIEWLFAGGDIVSGPDIIHGVADGHKAAVGIDEFLNREEE